MKTHRPLRHKRDVLDALQIKKILRRMAGELIERHHDDLENLLLVGIRTRGVPLSERLADEIEQLEGRRPALGVLDITLYRDDLEAIGPQPVVRRSRLPLPIDDKILVLCDDVLYTGRTVRAALDELADYGRPRIVRLAVLIDRGHRELPIQADVVGREVPTARSEVVEVLFRETDFADGDGDDAVRLLEIQTPSDSTT